MLILERKNLLKFINEKLRSLINLMINIFIFIELFRIKKKRMPNII